MSASGGAARAPGTTARAATAATLLVAMVAFPLWASRAQPYYLQVALNVLVFAVLALSWDLLARTGQLSLAHAAFYGLGGYTTTLLTTRAGVPIAAGILAGGVIAVAGAIALGLLTLRLRGIYFAIATLAFSETLRVITKQLRFTGGPAGLVAPPLLGGNLLAQYAVILGVLLLAVVTSWQVGRSRWRYAFTAIRTNEEVAAVMGVNVVRFKVLAFGISAFFAGIAGAYYAHVFLFINPFEAYSLAVSVGALVAPIFGGLYTTIGPLLGAAALRIGEEALRSTVRSGSQILYGLILAVAILYMPRGLLGVWAGMALRRGGRAPGMPLGGG